MANYGYHRTSTNEQHLDRGITEINKYAKSQGIQLAEIFTDQHTGKNFERPEFTFLRKRLLSGDTLIVTEIDRLGRNKNDILNILREFKDRGVRVIILEIPSTQMNFSEFDNSMTTMMLELMNNMMIEVYAVMAQAEIEKKEKRQKEGLIRKKACGEWDDIGRPRSISLGKFSEMYARVESKEIRPVDCQRELSISNSTYHRYKQELLAQK